ncbi:PKD domain protein,extracellular solute-binding protein, family 5 [Caldisphaera lagunensis DSM 15908]|uniref:PKD domain protein,extracellular solute-binding protein, family 5 n=1 Tax=Caldisphaera lagunensis (strain DSM 15908 / JCM 11604 / ANMR 0165 / IC-154) TaxID=1056495 RepID=L0A9W0_CALLD|nr:ABC transporter substrate-binding protein [Caldisphaera lagunensis]AFZ69927.1 PKD domain protein,extracellular solute-binding protein, family 5 [Caldisphaera lagunensis DSM 15908]
MSRKDRSLSKGALYGIIIVIIVVIIVGGVAAYYATKKPITTTTTTTSTTTSTPVITTSTTTTTTLSTLKPVATSTYASVAGTPINFVLSSFTPSSNRYALFYAGNGKIINTTSQYVNVTYNYPGHYLVYYNVYQSGSLIGSSQSNMIEITVAPNVPSSLSDLVTVPTITFNITRNPTAPIFSTGETVYLSGGFLQPPSGQNMTIYEYVWNFGNGQTMTVMANQTTLLPEENPVNVTYSSPGLYAVSLTIITKNVSSGKTYNYTTYQSVAVSSSTSPFAIYSSNLQVPNPGTIIVAENVPGGPYSFDPDIDWETVGWEVIANIFSTLVIFNGSSTTSFLPMAAQYIPTVGNWSQRNLYGGIAPNYSVYTFKIRPNLKFSNGDNLTAYDVWYSVIRGMLCAGGVPSTGGWLITQYLIPNYTPYTSVVTSNNEQQAFNEIMNAVTYDNQTNTVTFHLIEPVAPQLFFAALAHTLGGTAILDAKWLNQVGAGINFTPEGFYSYESECNLGNYNTQVQWNPVSSGPYMIKSYTSGQSVVLSPNPYWPTNIPNIPKPNDTVIIYWVKDPNTAYEMFASGQADIVVGLPSNYIPSIESLESQGQALLYEFPTNVEMFFVFNANISESMLKQMNPSYSIPSYYFANPLVRKAFAYAFNYTEYINDILGNKKYHFTFAEPYCGAIIPGLPYYIPPSELTGCPTLNLTYAKQLMEESGFYNISVYFPIIVTAGDTVDFTAAEMWASLLHEMDPNINAQPLYLPFSTEIADMIPGANPMPIYYLGWISGYPVTSFAVDSIYGASGAYPSPDGISSEYFENLSKYFASHNNTYLAQLFENESNEYLELNNLITLADKAALENNVTAAKMYYKQMEQLAINLYLYVYTENTYEYWVIKPYMHAYNNQITYQENPSFSGSGDSWYFWWIKG